MAKIGLKYPKYAKVTVTEDQSGNETETYGAVKSAGRAVSANISVNVSDEKFYADDSVAEVDPEFIDGTMALTVDDMTEEVISDLCGAAVDSGTGGTGDLIFGADDAAPYVRIGFVVPKIVRGEKKWVGVIYLRVKFSPPEDTFQTKGQSITFQGTSISGSIMKNADGKWKRMSADQSSEANAVSWLTTTLVA